MKVRFYDQTSQKIVKVCEMSCVPRKDDHVEIATAITEEDDTKHYYVVDVKWGMMEGMDEVEATIVIRRSW